MFLTQNVSQFIIIQFIIFTLKHRLTSEMKMISDLGSGLQPGPESVLFRVIKFWTLQIIVLPQSYAANEYCTNHGKF